MPEWIGSAAMALIGPWAQDGSMSRPLPAWSSTVPVTTDQLAAPSTLVKRPEPPVAASSRPGAPGPSTSWLTRPPSGPPVRVKWFVPARSAPAPARRRSAPAAREERGDVDRVMGEFRFLPAQKAELSKIEA